MLRKNKTQKENPINSAIYEVTHTMHFPKTQVCMNGQTVGWRSWKLGMRANAVKRRGIQVEDGVGNLKQESLKRGSTQFCAPRPPLPK